MGDESELQDTLAVMRDLRKRCDWDAAQTHQSLRPYLLEEAHELDDAITQGDDQLMREELGDVLLQVLFHSVIAGERGAFDFHDVARGLVAKMRARHAHLYGEEARQPWERMKSKQRRGIADGLPPGLPALHRAHRLQDRAAGVGFDWPDAAGPADKVEEELREVRGELDAVRAASPAPPSAAPGNGAPRSGPAAADRRQARVEEELGDLLFAVVNLCRKAGVHASLALDHANTKFVRRWERVEQLAAERGLVLGDAGLAQLDAIWEEVKQGERSL